MTSVNYLCNRCGFQSNESYGKIFCPKCSHSHNDNSENKSLKNRSNLNIKNPTFLGVIALTFSLYIGHNYFKNSTIEDLKISRENCSKVTDLRWDSELVAKSLKVPIRSVDGIRVTWDVGQFGTHECIMIFDTSKGPKSCAVATIIKKGNDIYASSTQIDSYSQRWISCY
jgi:hypothetical protein